MENDGGEKAKYQVSRSFNRHPKSHSCWPMELRRINQSQKCITLHRTEAKWWKENVSFTREAINILFHNHNVTSLIRAPLVNNLDWFTMEDECHLHKIGTIYIFRVRPLGNPRSVRLLYPKTWSSPSQAEDPGNSTHSPATWKLWEEAD